MHIIHSRPTLFSNCLLHVITETGTHMDRGFGQRETAVTRLSRGQLLCCKAALSAEDDGNVSDDDRLISYLMHYVNVCSPAMLIINRIVLYFIVIQ